MVIHWKSAGSTGNPPRRQVNVAVVRPAFFIYCQHQHHTHCSLLAAETTTKRTLMYQDKNTIIITTTISRYYQHSWQHQYTCVMALYSGEFRFESFCVHEGQPACFQSLLLLCDCISCGFKFIKDCGRSQ